MSRDWIHTRLLLGLIVIMISCQDQDLKRLSATPVRVLLVESASDTDGLRYSASIEPFTKVPLSFQAQARVEQILLAEGTESSLREVQPGDFVERGMILGRLDSSEYREKVATATAQLAASKAGLQAAKSSFERSSNLFSANSVTAPEFDLARKNYESALAEVAGNTAQLEQAQIALNDCTLRAPWNGVILQRNIEVGQLVGPTVDAFVLADVSLVKAVFGVPDLVLKDIQIDTPMALRTDSFPGRTFMGRVSSIAPAADQKSRVFEIQVTVPNPKNELRIGMIGSILLPKQVEPFPMVPLSAIVRDPQDPNAYAVYVVKKTEGETFPQLRKVKIGPVRGDLVSILEGVRLGEQVIANGATRVVSDHPIRIIP